LAGAIMAIKELLKKELANSLRMERDYGRALAELPRGCPFNCDFCNVTALLGHGVRVKTSRQILAELDSLYELGWRSDIFLVDDNFIGNKRILKTDLLPALIQWRKKKRGSLFFTEADRLCALRDSGLACQLIDSSNTCTSW